MRMSRRIVMVAVFGMLLTAGVQDIAALDCNAATSIRRVRTEQEGTFNRHVFQIDISTSEQCAVVEFSVILETRATGQDTQTVKKYRRVKFRTQTISTGHTYTAPPDVDVMSWRVEQISCRECQ